MPEVSLTDAQRWKLHQSKVIEAYKRVFGENPEKRTDAQRIVWEDLQMDKAGNLCAMRAAIADGRRSLLLYIAENVDFVPGAIVEEQQQPAKKGRT